MKTYVKFLEKFEKKLIKKIRKKGLTITISGLSSSGKSTGAKAIAKALNLRYFTVGDIQRQAAKEKGLSLEEQVKTREAEIDYKMDKTTLKLAMGGNCVLVGRLSGWVAGNWADVRIFYDCPLKVRAKRAALRDKIPFTIAMKNIRKRDGEDNKKYKKLYGIDSLDKSIYHIIINNEKITKEENEKLSVKLVKDFLKKRNTIAISGPPGAGTSAIARELAKKLKLECFSPGRVFKSYSEGKEAEAALNVWKSVGRSKKFHKDLDKLQVEKAKEGNVIICGKLSIHILKDLVNFKIWIQAPLKIRAKRVMKRDKISFKDALKMIKKRESIERGEWKKIYGFDYFNQKRLADFVLNTKNLTLKESVEKILEFIHKKN
jgi:cytidylate kinase